jgi:uncharacterized protein YkwD
MPDHARFRGRALCAATALLALTPAAAATAAELPPAVPGLPDLPVIDAPEVAAPGLPPADPPSAPAVPSVALPPLASAAASCRGARRRSGTKRRCKAVRCLVNHARNRAGIRGFRRNGPLARAATRHARDMARRRYFAHQRAGGPPLSRRARRAGWRGRRVGEAIAYGCRRSATPRAIVSMWLASPTHAAILLSRSLRRAGVGSARAPMSCRGATYVLVAGRG